MRNLISIDLLASANLLILCNAADFKSNEFTLCVGLHLVRPWTPESRAGALGPPYCRRRRADSDDWQS